MLMPPFALKPLNPVVMLSRLPLLLPCGVLQSCNSTPDAGRELGYELRLLHLAGAHIFNPCLGGRRSQVIELWLSFFCDTDGFTVDHDL